MRSASALALLVLLGGCSGPPVPLLGGSTPAASTLRVALGGSPASLDPALQRDPWEHALASFYTEALLAPRPDLADVQPAAAQSYDVSADGLVYTFHLRRDGRFSDGSAVTAADFVTAWRRLIDPRVGSPHADAFAAVVRGGAYAEALDPEDPAAKIDPAVAQLGLRALDALTFQVVLARPAPWFKWLATVWAGAPSKPNGISNGPFAIASAGPDLITLVPNQHFRAKPRLSKVLAYEIGAGAEALQMYRSGTLDIAPVDANTIAAVRPDRRLRSELRQIPELTTGWLVFNAFRDPFRDASVRRAFAESLDRRAYVDGPLASLGDASFQLLPAGMPDRLAGPAGLETYDPAQARSLLAASGARTGGLHLLVEDTPTGHAFAAYVRQQLAVNLGVGLAVDSVSPKTFSDRIANRDFDLAGPQLWAADYPDPQNWLDLFLTTNGANAGRWQDSLYDALVGLGDSSGDAGDRSRAYRQAELELDRQAPAAFLAQRVAALLVSPRVGGLTLTADDPTSVLAGLTPVDLTVSG